MSQQITSILVPTDGSEGALVGARRGIDLASTIGARLHVLAVLDTRETEPLPWPSSSDDRSEREQVLSDQAERAVDEVATLARSHLDQPVSTTVEAGVPHRSITEYADQHAIDLVVMGTRGRTGLERVLLGSVAEKTLRTSDVPVVMVPPDADIVEIGDTSYRNLLLPTDGSDGAEVAIDLGITLAEAYDATVHTVYSVDTSRFLGARGFPELHEALEQFGHDALEAVRDRARSAEVSVAGYVGSGPAVRVILAYGDTHDIDLIVMGTHGRSGLDRQLLGSVTEEVVRGADVPVCCVPMAAT